MTASPTALLALADAVEAATGPDRELDAKIAELALGAGIYTEFSPWQMSYGGTTRKIPKYTAKVDAVLGLLADVLPGYVCTCSTYGFASKMPIADVYREGHEGRAQGKAPTLPRAIVAASLRAVAARGEG